MVPTAAPMEMHSRWNRIALDGGDQPGRVPKKQTKSDDYR